jgi:iron complex transport system substrate-binding protein
MTSQRPRRKRILLGIERSRRVFLFCLISFSLLTPTGESARLVVDQAGREVRVPDDPQRVIALAPSLTEMVYALGAESQLHGVTEFSNFPDAARALPRVGSYIRPDVVDPRNLQGIMETITGIGDVLGVPEKAVALVRDMRSRIDRVKARVAGTTGRPEVFFQIAVAPIVSVGTNTFIHELIQMAGGVNLTAGAVPYPRVTWEEILFLQPEITIISSMAGGHSPENLKSEWTRWQQLPSVRTGRVYVVDANLFDRPTTRLVEGLEVLVDIIHPKVTARTEETGGR